MSNGFVFVCVCSLVKTNVILWRMKRAWQRSWSSSTYQAFSVPYYNIRSFSGESLYRFLTIFHTCNRREDHYHNKKKERKTRLPPAVISTSALVFSSHTQLNNTPHLIHTKEPISCLLEHLNRRNSNPLLWLLCWPLQLTDNRFTWGEVCVCVWGGGHTKGRKQLVTCWPGVGGCEHLYDSVMFGTRCFWSANCKNSIF